MTPPPHALALMVPQPLRPLLPILAASMVAIASAAGATSPPAADSDDDALATFAAANASYARDDYAAAAASFQSLIDSGRFAPEVFYNLGNAHYRLGDRGAAALAYRRALALRPWDPESRQNLRFLRRQLGFVDLDPPGATSLARTVPFTWAVYAFTAAAWVFVLGVTALALVRAPRFPRTTTAIVSIAAFVVACTAASVVAASHFLVARPAERSVVTTGGSAAHTAPSHAAPSVITLPEGSEVKVLTQRGTWTYVSLFASGAEPLRGWVDSSHLQPLWPFDPTLLR